MLIAISASTANFDGPVSSQFGRCPYFIFLDTEKHQWEAKTNPALEATGGAGTKAAQLVVEHGAKAVISGQYGPKAEQVLRTAGLQLFTAPNGTVAEAAAEFEANRLTPVTT